MKAHEPFYRNGALAACLAVFLMLMVFTCGCAQQTPRTPATVPPPSGTGKQLVTFTGANDGTTVDVGVLSNFAVQLEENPTTGYMWNATLGPGLTLVSTDYRENAHPEGMVGVGGTRTWIIRAAENGTLKFTAFYRRSWEQTTGSEKTYTLTINVVKI